MLDKAKFFGETICQGQNDYKKSGIFYGLFLAPKTNYCLTKEKHGIVQEHKTFKSFNDSERLLNCSQSSNMIDG